MAPVAAMAIPAVLGAIGSYKDAKSAKKAAEKGVNSTEKTTRTPYGPATSHIQTILDEAGRLYGQGGPQGPMPYAWQNFMNNPTSPGIGADPTYGGASPSQGGAPAANLNWRGRDRSEVQATKAAKQQARYERQQQPQQAQSGPSGAGGGGGMGMAAGASQAQPGAAAGFQSPFQAQQGPFGYSQGIRDYMMQNFLGQGVGGYQPAMNYIQGLLGGQSQNPMLTQAFSRISGPQQNYFSAFMPKG